MKRRILLLYNTPKARRYFATLGQCIDTLDIRCQAISVRGGARLDDKRYAQMAQYSMLRKQARTRIPPWRMRTLQSIHQQFAHWHYHSAAARIRALSPNAVGVWGGQSVDTRAALAAAADLGVPHYIFECGLLPNTTTCDPRGVNFDNSVPRNPGFYARRAERKLDTLTQHLVPRKTHRNGDSISLPENYLFVPFQVRLDSQVLCYSPFIRNMPQLFNAVCEAARSALAGSHWKLVFKLHPSCRQEYPELVEQAAAMDEVLFANNNDTEQLIRQSRGVVTLNSTVGIEALLLQRPVLTLGQACYAIPGVCDSADSVEGISRWVRGLRKRGEPGYPLRTAFLDYLTKDYCIPGSHKAVDQAHLHAMQQRLASHPDATYLPLPHSALFAV